MTCICVGVFYISQVFSNNQESFHMKEYMALDAFSVTAPFNYMQTLKFKAQPTNLSFATVNQMFGGSSQLLTMLSELCSRI